MGLRGVAVAGGGFVLLAMAAVAAWPIAEERAARALERRLSDELGGNWKVGSVSLRLMPSPDIVARDIDRTDSLATGRIRTVRLDDPLALLGSGGAVHAIAEGLELRVPLAMAAVKPWTGQGVSVRAAIRGGSARIDDDGRTAAIAAEAADVTATPRDGSSPADIRVRFDLPGYGLDIAATSAGPAGEAGPLSLKLEPANGGHRVEAKGKVLTGPDEAKLDAIAGTIDGEPFSGALGIAFGAKPRLALDLKLDRLALIDASIPAPGGTDGLVIPVTPDVMPDIRWFQGVEAKGSVSVVKLRLGGISLSGFALQGSVKDGTLDAAMTATGLYDGQLRGRYVLSPDPRRAGRHQLSVSLARVAVKPLLSDAAGVRGLDGVGSGRLDLQATGNRVDDVARALTGKAEFAITDGRVDGLDLAGAFGLLPGGGDGGRLGALATRLDRLAGAFDVTEGQAFTNDLQLKTPLIEATGVGRLDLPARTLDFRFKPQVAASGDKRPAGRLDVPVHVTGPWTNPRVSADLSGIAENPGAAIQSLQDLGTKLLGEDGGDMGGNLGGLIDSLIPRSEPPRAGQGQPGRRRSLSPE